MTKGECEWPYDVGRVKAWQVCDEDIVAAYTWEDAVDYWVKNYDGDSDLVPDEWQPVDLGMQHFRDASHHDAGKCSLYESILEQAKEKGPFPFVVSSTEF